jgi:predicted AAA+ superfamily ATPase
LVGPRGTGKTTLLLQFIKDNLPNPEECIYISIDHIYFSKNLLFDFIEDMYTQHGIRYFFLDEIHKYPNWNQELKNIYDSYPDIKIVFSGSSSIDLIRGSFDLSRRGVLHRIHGMSFREYLIFKEIAEIAPLSFEDIISNRAQIESILNEIPKLLSHFSDYLEIGYYPFFLEGVNSYHDKLLRVVEKTVFEDISNFYKLKTHNLSNFKKVLSYLSTITPGEFSLNSIAKNIGIDSKTIQTYFQILSETGLVELLNENKAGANLLKNKKKVFLDNPNLYSVISSECGHSCNVGTVREIFFIKMLKNSGHNVFYSQVGDFECNNTIFEVGGKNKKTTQIKNSQKNSFLVKDGIMYGSKTEIPLHLFGFLY